MIAAAAITPTSLPRRAAAREAVGHERVEVGGVEHRQRDRDEQRQRGDLDQRPGSH